MVTDLIQRVRSHLAEPRITKAGLAGAAGLHANTLRDADTDQWNPNAATLKKLERYFAERDSGAGHNVSATKSDENIRKPASPPQEAAA